MIYIYSLSHPDSLQIKYIGKTKDIKRRLQSHIDYAKYNKKRRKVTDWINSLLSCGKKPVITIIEVTTVDGWPDREIYWIKHFKQLGFDLCNLTDGGESNNGYVYTDELKEIRRKARQGWIFPNEVKNKISHSLSRKVERNDGKLFNSMKEAIKESGVAKSTFHRKFHKSEKINGFTYTWYNLLTLNPPQDA